MLSPCSGARGWHLTQVLPALLLRESDHNGDNHGAVGGIKGCLYSLCTRSFSHRRGHVMPCTFGPLGCEIAGLSVADLSCFLVS
eukprot:m.147992 g.147992  ORF g.147992 m.147992 type:complete len:84 (-) comp15053_c1_seq6:54-305(-)